MSQKKTIDQVLPGFSDGFPLALRLWLLFLLSLFFLGYPVPFSILMGAVGGFAGGWVFSWWKSKDEPVTIQSEEPEESEEIPVKLSGLTLAKQRRDDRKAKQDAQKAKKGVPQRSVTLFGGLSKR